MQEQVTKRIDLKIPLYFITAGLMILLFFVFGSVKADAKTITITTPEQLKDINWVNKGFGPGNTYVIGNDMTLGEADDATCLLTKGDFVIDFNGHTVQNASAYNTVFSIKGANVTMLDSKVSSSKPSVRSYGQGTVQITAGKLTIKSGNYLGASNGQNNPVGLHVGGGTCVVNGGWFGGAYTGGSSMGGNFYINNGTFQGGFPFALMSMGGNIKITRGNFIAGQTNYGYSFPLGAYCQQQYYDFSSWFVNGATLSPGFQTGYWNMQSQLSGQPFLGSTYAVTYTGTDTLTVNNTAILPGRPGFPTISNKGTTLNVGWKQTARTSGYYVQMSTNPKFTSGVKTVTVKSASTLKAAFSGIKANTMYYVRIRSFRSFNGGTFCSAWTVGCYNPTAPKITPTKNASSAVGIAWSKGNGVSVCRVYRKAGSGKWTKLADVKTTSYVDKSVKKGVTYQYAIRGVAANGKYFTTKLGPAKSVRR